MAPSIAQESMLHWCRGVCRWFEHEYLHPPTHQDIVTQMTMNQDRDGLVCLVALIACIENENYVMLLCHGPIKTRTKTCPSSWRLFVIIDCGIGMHSLAFQGETMI